MDPNHNPPARTRRVLRGGRTRFIRAFGFFIDGLETIQGTLVYIDLEAPWSIGIPSFSSIYVRFALKLISSSLATFSSRVYQGTE
jgi:hypothetical protein